MLSRSLISADPGLTELDASWSSSASFEFAQALATGTEPSEPWHPEAYCHRREEANGATREAAIANVKAKALSTGLTRHADQSAVIWLATITASQGTWNLHHEGPIGLRANLPQESWAGGAEGNV